jgi:hypothetical protein
MGEIRNAYNTLVAKLEGKTPLENLVIDGMITLEWILEKQGGKV